MPYVWTEFEHDRYDASIPFNMDEAFRQELRDVCAKYFERMERAIDDNDFCHPDHFRLPLHTVLDSLMHVASEYTMHDHGDAEMWSFYLREAKSKLEGYHDHRRAEVDAKLAASR